MVGPGAQVGATWALKSHLSGVRTAKNRVKRGKVVPSRSCCLSELWNGTQRDATGRNGTDRDATGRNGTGYRIGSEVKVYLNDQSYD